MKKTIILLLLIVGYGFTSLNLKQNIPIPVITSEWKRIVYYPENHLGNFCIFQNQEDKSWHTLGVMGLGYTCSESNLFHSSGNNLLAPFKNHTPIQDKPIQESKQNYIVKPPHMIWYNGYYHMFYRSKQRGIAKKKSQNINDWNGIEEEKVFKEKNVYDVYITNINGVFHMYYCRSIEYEGTNRSAVLLKKSTDLENWSESVIVYVDLEYIDNYSKLSSPCVVKEKEGYYLFLRNRHLVKKNSTIVLFSKNAEEFPSGIHTWMHELENTDGAKIIKYNEKNYIVRISGPQHVDIQKERYAGWLDIAEIEFK